MVDYLSWGISFYEALRNDEKYQKYIDEFITPSADVKRKAEVSSTAGAIVGKVFGLGWRSVVGTAITLKEHPIAFMMMIDHKDEWKEKVCFFFSTGGYATSNDRVNCR